jgi:hypothetical protein
MKWRKMRCSWKSRKSRKGIIREKEDERKEDTYKEENKTKEG